MHCKGSSGFARLANGLREFEQFQKGIGGAQHDHSHCAVVQAEDRIGGGVACLPLGLECDLEPQQITVERALPVKAERGDAGVM